MHRIFEFREIDSTSTYLKNNYLSLQEGDVITAHHQTQGRGRKGRVWQDDSSSLLFSILLKENLKAELVELLPLLTGVSLVNTLDSYGISSSIKWPNDVLINGRKCSGILLEGVTGDAIQAVIIGVGINLNNKSFDSSISSKAISLSQVLKRDLDKKEVLDRFLRCFDKLYADYQKGTNSFIPILKSHSYLDGKEVYLNYYGEQKHGVVKGIEDNGRLKVITDRGPISLNAGEVSLESVYESN